jgi:hypothetical protein
VGVERCQFESAASSRAPCLDHRVSCNALAALAVRCHNFGGTYLAIITTSGCRPIAVGDEALGYVVYFGWRKRLKCSRGTKAMRRPFLLLEVYCRYPYA